MAHVSGWALKCVVSGGQTGVDRGALDAAIHVGLLHGGWCPHGRLAEDGVIPARYRLQETAEAAYRFRTEWNVRDSDGTLILFKQRVYGGTLLTHRFTLKYGKPCLLVDLAGDGDQADIITWLRNHRIEVLNVAGPRESSLPGITAEALDLLVGIFARCRD
jgi:hypothetical protein